MSSAMLYPEATIIRRVGHPSSLKTYELEQLISARLMNRTLVIDVSIGDVIYHANWWYIITKMDMREHSGQITGFEIKAEDLEDGNRFHTWAKPEYDFLVLNIDALRTMIDVMRGYV